MHVNTSFQVNAFFPHFKHGKNAEKINIEMQKKSVNDLENKRK